MQDRDQTNKSVKRNNLGRKVGRHIGRMEAQFEFLAKMPLRRIFFGKKIG